MIVGIGVDIVKISRVNINLAKRILSNEEYGDFNNFKTETRKQEYLAGRFSVKEAVIKAIGTTKYRIGMRDITILNDETGMPILKNPIYEDIKFFISISHEKDSCVGLCVIESV